MHLAAGTALALAGASLTAAPALAAPTAYDLAFVDAFAEACVPQRLSYPGTQQNALATGWTAVERSAHPELDTLLGLSEAGALDPELFDTAFEYQAYERPLEGQPHFLVVSRASAAIEAGGDPWINIGCYLYNFDAVAPIDPEPVTALIGQPISGSQIDMHLNAWVWGPPCPMPRTGDTYLTFVPEVSQYRDQTGFSGLVLKFDTSEPKPDEVVPASYC